MKRILTILCALAIVMAGSATAMAAEPEAGQSASYYPISVEEYTYGPLDELRINKTYQLSLSDDPSLIPTGDFTRNGRHYYLLDMTRKDEVGVDIQTHTETVTKPSDTNNLETILQRLDAEMEVTTEDGYVGVLRLDHTSVQVTTDGYATKTNTLSASRSYTQCAAGWYDWFCQDSALAGRLKKIGRVVMGITDPFILDNYFVWFKNNCPLDGPLYDDARFEPLSGKRDGKYFVIALDSPHERKKWALVTERYGFYAPEFDCRDIREMIRYVNSIGPELQQGTIPPFIAEKDAVTAYARQRGEPESLHIYRDGDHCYSYTSRRDQRRRTVLAAASLEGAPAGFASEQAHSIRGMYVYCPEDAGIPLPSPQKEADKAPKRKEAER